MIEIKMSNEQKVQVHLAATRPDPKDPTLTVPAPIDGEITYEVTQGDATVDATDNANPFFISGDAAMESKILARADADLGEGVVEIVQEFSINVSFPQATAFSAVVDTPVAK